MFVLFTFSIVFCIIVTLNLFVTKFYSTYYDNHDLFFDRYHLFFLGSFYGYLTLKYKWKRLEYLYVFFVISFFSQKLFPELNCYYESMKKICIYMPICCFFFILFEKIYVLSIFKTAIDWCGNYSLELYILHSIIFCFIMRINSFSYLVPSTFVSIVIAITAAFLLAIPVNRLTQKIVVFL